MADFTPGPWHAERRQSCSVVLQKGSSRDGYSNRIAECLQWSPAGYLQPTPDDAFANATLMAAAPSMFDALVKAKVLIGAGNDGCSDAVRQSNVNEAWHLINAAIALAGGETPSDTLGEKA